LTGAQVLVEGFSAALLWFLFACLLVVCSVVVCVVNSECFGVEVFAKDFSEFWADGWDLVHVDGF